MDDEETGVGSEAEEVEEVEEVEEAAEEGLGRG